MFMHRVYMYVMLDAIGSTQDRALFETKKKENHT